MKTMVLPTERCIYRLNFGPPSQATRGSGVWEGPKAWGAGGGGSCTGWTLGTDFLFCGLAQLCSKVKLPAATVLVTCRVHPQPQGMN